jgi:hypothetical protein
MAEIKTIWIPVAEALILQELQRQQEDKMFEEFTQFGMEKRLGLSYPGKDDFLKDPEIHKMD